MLDLQLAAAQGDPKAVQRQVRRWSRDEDEEVDGGVH